MDVGAPSLLTMAAFTLDVTPPVGATMAFGVNKGTASPIYIRGILLDDGRVRNVLISCDFLYIWGQAWQTWRGRIAEAASTMKERVFLHCVHQHDSMRIVAHEDMEAPGSLRADLSYGEATLEKLVAAVRDAVEGEWKSIARLMTAERRMDQLASNRRLIGGDGKWFATRYSMCADPTLRALPVGTIDPLLRTVAFGDEAGRILAAIHFYATHPMTAYGREMVCADVPGAALEYAGEKIGAETFQMYFTGCSGNVTLGKYYLDDKEESLRMMGRRLGDGMVSNIVHLEERPLSALSFREVSFEFPFDFNEQEGNRLGDAKRFLARNIEKWRRAFLYRLSLGDRVHILSFPSEVVVEYQLYAQALAPEHFVACASHGDSTYFYLPTAWMFKEGGYEPSVSLATPEIEERLKTAIAEILTTNHNHA